MDFLQLTLQSLAFVARALCEPQNGYHPWTIAFLFSNEVEAALLHSRVIRVSHNKAKTASEKIQLQLFVSSHSIGTPYDVAQWYRFASKPHLVYMYYLASSVSKEAHSYHIVGLSMLNAEDRRRVTDLHACDSV